MSTIQPLPEIDKNKNTSLSKKVVKIASHSYVFSLPWFLGGLIVFAVLFLLAFGLRTFHVHRMSNQIIEISQALEQGDDLKNAIDVVSSFLRAQPDNPEVWKHLCKLWGRMYAEKLFANNAQLQGAINSQKRALPFISEQESRSIRERILEMEWESIGNSASARSQAMYDATDILKRWNDHPLATKVLALGAFAQIQEAGVPSIDNSTTVDRLLIQALALNPDDIDLAVAYGDLLMNLDSYNAQRYVSGALWESGAERRREEAESIVNQMVDRNPAKMEAYRARYIFRSRHRMLSEDALELDPDLEVALRLDPESPMTLQIAGMQLFYVSKRAQSRKLPEIAEKNRETAVKLLQDSIRLHPEGDTGYLLLGIIYYDEDRQDDAIGIWETGRSRFQVVNPDVNARLALIYIDRKQYDKVAELIDEIERFWTRNKERLQVSREKNIFRTFTLVRSRMYLSQRDDALDLRNEAIRKSEELRAKGLAPDSSLDTMIDASNREARTKRKAAVDLMMYVFRGLSEIDYDTSGSSILSVLEGDSFIRMGFLELENNEPDKAVMYFVEAMRFPQFAATATLNAALAQQQRGQSDSAIAILRRGADRFPENAQIQYALVDMVFRTELNRTDPTERGFLLVEGEINKLEKFRGVLRQPWNIDLMRIQLHFARGGGMRQAQLNALSALRELEENAEYSADLNFLAEVAGQYSKMGSYEDFNRMVEKIQKMPQHDVHYFRVMINNAMNRGDQQTALLFAEEAILAVPDESKAQFINLKTRIENPNALQVLDDPSERFSSLLELYENQRMFEPETFFELANLALARDELDLAQNIEDRLKQIEGTNTERWKFLAGRRLIKQYAKVSRTGLLDEAQRHYEEIVRSRPNWDMTYVLLAEIEKAKHNINGAITAYQSAIEKGCNDPAVYREAISLLYEVDRVDDANALNDRAMRRFGSAFAVMERVFPQPYQGYYEQIYMMIADGDIGMAEKFAENCMKKAAENQEPSHRILDLNMEIGKLFMDASVPDAARKYLSEVAGEGGIYIYPMAECYIKMGEVDEAFNLLIGELEKTSDHTAVLPSIILMLSKLKPSEELMVRLDEQMSRLEPVLIEKMPTLFPLAEYWTLRGQKNKAIAVQRAGLLLDPDRWEIINNLALLLADMSEGDEIPLAKGTFSKDNKRIPLSSEFPRQSIQIRFPGKETGSTPRASDFRFMARP